MTLVSLIGVSLTGTFLTLLLRETHERIARFVPVSTGILVAFFLVDELTGITAPLLSLADQYGITAPLSASLKAIGLGYVTDIGSGVIRDLGENGMAARIEAFGHIAIVAAALPFLTELLTVALRYLS